MKTIGMTKEGNHLVEMSVLEYGEFVRLHSAVEGYSRADISLRLTPYPFQAGMDFDFSSTFGVIRSYYINKFYINEFQQILSDMKKSLEKEDG